MPALKLNAYGKTCELWLSGAKVFNEDAFRHLAPLPMQEMEPQDWSGGRRPEL